MLNMLRAIQGEAFAAEMEHLGPEQPNPIDGEYDPFATESEIPY